MKSYEVKLTEEAISQLKKLPKEFRKEIGHRLFLLEDGLTGDIKKLKGLSLKGLAMYRLRVGTYRIIFTVEKDTVTVYTVQHRKDVYRK